MELLQLIYFCHAAETENFAKTAREYRLPAASISQSVKRLESELGASLFDRSPNGVKLNEHGRVLYMHAKSALSMLEDAEKKIRDEEVGGTIRILAETHRNAVNNAIMRFRESYKNVSFHVDQKADKTIEKYDLIVTDNVPFRKNYKTVGFVRERILLALNKEHPLAKKTCVAVAELADERFIIPNIKSGLYTITRRICAAGSFEPTIAIETDDPHYMMRCIDQKLGIGIIPAIDFASFVGEDTVLREIETTNQSNLVRPSSILYNTQQYMSKATKLFLDALTEMAKELS